MEIYYYSIVRESSSYFVQNEFDYIAHRGALCAAADLVEEPGEARRSQESQENPGGQMMRWGGCEHHSWLRWYQWHKIRYGGGINVEK